MQLFVGTLDYADDIVLIAPTPGAMRKMLSVCDDFASKFDIVFNASKSQFIVIVPYKNIIWQIDSIDFALLNVCE